MFDMDGVLCDFAYWVECNHAWKDYNPRIEERKVNWGKLEEIGSSFWSNMPWLSEGQKLYHLVLEYAREHNDVEIGIHSAIDIYCGKAGKYLWVEKNCPEIAPRNIKIVDDGRLKHVSGKDSEILVDDRDENVKAYLEAGFPAVLFTTACETFSNIIKLIAEKSMVKN